MPRHARVRLAGCPWHVWQRGVNRSACFHDDLDRQRYLGLLKDHAGTNGCAVHAFVLMDNHVHLLITPNSEDGLSDTMKAVNERYVPQFNRRHGRTGTLWEGRFRSNVVQSERYLFVLQTYIEQNPVRARMVTHPAEHPWSSYLTNATGSPQGLITPHERYLALAADPLQRGIAYQRLFDVPTTEKHLELIREAIAGGYALGDEVFTRRLETEGICVRPGKPGPKPGSGRQQKRAESSALEFGVRPLFA